MQEKGEQFQGWLQLRKQEDEKEESKNAIK